MLIKESWRDVETPTGKMRVFLSMPALIDSYPQARFPGVVVFNQVTAPVSRFANSIAAQGYICASPCVFHEFEEERALPYDGPGTDAGNAHKKDKLLKAYDDDAKATVDLLVSLPNCNGRIASTGMCLGGHLAFRAAFDSRVLAAVCYFPTDIHSESLGSPGPSDSLKRAEEIKGELVTIFGVADNHVPLAGRDKIRARCHSLSFPFTFLELQAAHAFIRDELSKGRFDGALAKVCFELLLETFNRTVARDLGPRSGQAVPPPNVC